MLVHTVICKNLKSPQILKVLFCEIILEMISTLNTMVSTSRSTVSSLSFGVHSSLKTAITTTSTVRTTPILPSLSFKEVASCHPEYNTITHGLSCDFTTDFCNFTQPEASLNWYRTKKDNGWLAKIPNRHLNGKFNVVRFQVLSVQ